MSPTMKMNLRARLLPGFGAMLLLTLLLAGWSVWQLRALRLNADEISDNWLPSVEHRRAMNAALGYLRLSLAQETQQRAKFNAELGKSREEFEQALMAYLPLASSPQEQQLADALREAMAAYFQLGERLQQQVNAGQSSAAQELATTQMLEQGLKTRTLIQQINRLNHGGAAAEQAAAHTTYQRALWSLSGAAAAESLRQQADTLVRAVAVFRTGVPAAATPTTPAKTSGWDGAERRGPARATNVSRPAFGRPAARVRARTGTDGAWTDF